MNTNEIEDLFLRSLDQTLSDAEKEQLVNALRTNSGLAKDVSQYKSIRESILRSKPATFGPYFAHKVITRIQGLRVEIDKQIIFFFKKYQLAALGVFIALLAVNVIFSDQLDVPSVLGIKEEAAAIDEEIIDAFDFQSNLTNN